MSKNNVDDLQAQIDAAQEALKALRNQKKELTKKEKAPLKGRPVRWVNKAGQEIKGLGTLYYCVTLNGVTHLKQVDSVELLDKL